MIYVRIAKHKYIHTYIATHTQKKEEYICINDAYIYICVRIYGMIN